MHTYATCSCISCSLPRCVVDMQNVASILQPKLVCQWLRSAMHTSTWEHMQTHARTIDLLAGSCFERLPARAMVKGFQETLKGYGHRPGLLLTRSWLFAGCCAAFSCLSGRTADCRCALPLQQYASFSCARHVFLTSDTDRSALYSTYSQTYHTCRVWHRHAAAASQAATYTGARKLYTNSAHLYCAPSPSLCETRLSSLLYTHSQGQ
jgi:hypothetical protein